MGMVNISMLRHWTAVMGRKNAAVSDRQQASLYSAVLTSSNMEYDGLFQMILHPMAH